MSYHVTCGACGFRNPLGRLHCVKCGERLVVSEKTVRPELGGLQRFGQSLGRLFRLALSLGLLFGLIQVLRPVQPMGQSGTAQHANEMDQKLDLLQYATLERQAMRQSLSEPEVNGYLAQILADTPDRTASGLMKFELQMINLRFREGEIVTVMLSAWQSLNLTYEIRTKVVPREQGVGLEVTGLRLGHLPMPRPAAEWAAGRLANVFGRMEREKSLLDQLSALEVQDGVAVATVPGQ
jgi:hypothetical protein